jgi:hypothetical protein
VEELGNDLVDARCNPLLRSVLAEQTHWWTPVPEVAKPDQAAEPGQVILSKRDKLGILSNFTPTPFVYRGKRYASVEGFGK